MLVDRKEYTEPDNSVGYIESIFDSSNILKTTYFPKKNMLYVSFNRGGTYSYSNVRHELYEQFEQAESQGKFFVEEIKKNPNKFPYAKEFSLRDSEVDSIKKIIREHKEKEQGNVSTDNRGTSK